MLSFSGMSFCSDDEPLFIDLQHKSPTQKKAKLRSSIASDHSDSDDQAVSNQSQTPTQKRKQTAILMSDDSNQSSVVAESISQSTKPTQNGVVHFDRGGDDDDTTKADEPRKYIAKLLQTVEFLLCTRFLLIMKILIAIFLVVQVGLFSLSFGIVIVICT